jgi:CRISPR-associated protein Csd1
MSILASLAKAYERLEGAPPFGYTAENIHFVVSLNNDGTVAGIIDLCSIEGKRRVPRILQVPASFKRPGVTPRPFFLWDNANYALGISGNADSEDTRFSAFREKHLQRLQACEDAGLIAFTRFLTAWRPEDMSLLHPVGDLLTAKVVFALEEERRERFLHDRPAAKALWTSIAEVWKAVEGKSSDTAVCLITGEVGTVARTHPAIRGIRASAGAKDADSIVAFNHKSFESYEHEQGDNAPISEAAAFRYTTALNAFLAKDSRNRIQIGDASTVFWADHANSDTATKAEAVFVGMFDGGISELVAQFEEVNEEIETRKIEDILQQIRKGRPLEQFAPELSDGVRFHVLGLAPNAARLSIRFWFDNDFDILAKNYQRFSADMRIEPLPRKYAPSLGRNLLELIPLTKSDRRFIDERWATITRNLPDGTKRHLSLLAADWMRAILNGTAYPQTLLSTVLMRICADGEVNALRVAILKALVVRNFKREAPVSLDPENTNKGYLLGRLFAVYEFIQTAALGRDLNSTIKDKFYGAASCTPSSVFALLDRGSVNHLSKIGKERPGWRVNLEKTIASIMEAMNAADNPFPASLAAADQALFGLGYYHQRSELFSKPESRETGEPQS